MFVHYIWWRRCEWVSFHGCITDFWFIHADQSSQMRMKQCNLWIHLWNIENVSNFNS